jgi:Ca-activated chloride channel homolog
MELLNPAGLFWLAALPLLLVPYWLRQRPRPRRVPALFLYEGIEKAQRVRLGGRLRLRPLFFLQLLLLLLIIAALCRPFLLANEVRSALVLDNSASLQAIDAVGESRFAAARRAGGKALDEDPATTWDLFTLSPDPREVALGVSRGEAANRLGRIEVGSCPHPDDGALRAFFDRLSRQNYSQIHVVTDRQGKSSAPFQVATVGAPRANLAITDLTLVSAGMSGQASQVNVAVENFSAKAATAPITIEDAGSGRAISNGRLDLGPGGSASFAAEVPAGTRVRARLGSEDALALDNQAVASTPAARAANVLLVSAKVGGLATLEQALDIRLEVVAPESYRPELGLDRDLVIFHLAAPGEPPPSPALYLLPPDMPYLPATAGRIEAPNIAFPNPTHPAVRYLNSAALRPRSGFILRDTPEWEALALADGGPLVLSRRTASGPQVISGIDLLPYLGDRNRPVSILTLNLLSWLLRGRAAENHGEECLPLGAAESNLAKRSELPLPATKAPAPTTSTRKTPLWSGLVLGALGLCALEAWFQRGAGGSLWVLRFAVVAILVIAAFDPAKHLPGAAEKPLVVADVSKSLLAEVRDRELADVRRITGPAGAAVAFGTEPVSSTIAQIAQATAAAGPNQTDIETALSLAAEQAPQGSPLLLVTDGWETRGDVRRALDSLAARRIRVYPVAEPQPVPSNVAVQSLSLPAESVTGRAARAEVLVRSDNSRPVSGRVAIRQGGKIVSQGEVKLPPGDSVITRPLLVVGEGLIEFSAEIQTVDPSTNLKRDDDVAKSWIAVGGRRRILLIGHTERENRDLAAALTQRGFHATQVATAAEGARPPEAGGFGAIILNDVAIAELPRGYPEGVREYVRGGGSLLMVGGPRGFGLGGYRGSPIEEALPVDMKERSREEPRNSVALVIDKSGSMREERRIVFAREAARQLVNHLNDRDRLAVIGFDREAFEVIPLAEVGEIRYDFDRRIDRLRPSGGTRLFPALVEARRQLRGEEAKKRHIIVLSDGLSEDGETASGRRHYYDLALALAEQGVTISTVALGRDADADFLERLASYGRGAFHETKDASDLPEIVLGEFREHARERTMRERELRPVPSGDSPLVGEIARADSRWPAVLGLVETELKPRARLDVAVAGSDAPLIASWEYGRGRAAAVTTDADGRWSDRWVRWGEWSRLWSGIAGWLVPESAAPQARFVVAYRDGVLEVDYSRFDKDPAGGVTARIAGPGGLAEEIPLERAALGHYRGRLATRSPGDYRIEIRRPGEPAMQPPLGYTVPAAATAEWPRREPNWGLLEEIAAKTSGKVNPALDSIESAPAPETKLPLAPILLPAAMLLFVAELVLRRLRA